jgi:pimeloyl-ACP methyl ester carboxylesterase
MAITQVRLSTGVELVADVHSDERDTQATPLVLLHGLSQQRHFWWPVVRRLHSRPVTVLDQRMHGDSDCPLDTDVSIRACADDVIALLDAQGWDRAVIVGHSWGAAVAADVAATHPERTVAVGLIDGGLFGPAGLGPRDEVRRRLTPPSFGIPEDELWEHIAAGAPGGVVSSEMREALSPTFVRDDNGLMRTRIGVDRHLAVLDGLLDHDLEADLDAAEAAGVPVWASVCTPSSTEASHDEWTSLKAEAVERARRRTNLLVHTWAGALHDVPLQWPALVAGFIDALVESRKGGER